MNKEETFKKSSHITRGSVFDDLGLSKERSAIEKLKFEIFSSILEAIEKNGLSPRDIEKLLDKPQPRISELLNGKIAGTSLDKLVTYLETLGGSINLKVKLKKIA